MDYEILPFHRLRPEHRSLWLEIQQGNPSLDSPYFHPGFAEVVGEVRDDLQVAVIAESGQAKALLPFHRVSGNFGLPVAGLMSDFHGLIAPAGFDWDAEELIRACGLRSWEFHCLLQSQQPFAQHAWHAAPSAYIEVAEGLESLAAARPVRRTTIGKSRQKARKMARQLGPLRLVPASDDPQVFETLLAWKHKQYQRTGFLDVLALGWPEQLLRNLLPRRDACFGGMLSALYAGDRLAAVHLGMRCGGVLHAWYPTYDTDLSEYSPGLILWLELIQAAPSLGLERIDLGKGSTQFKDSFMTGAVQVAEGSVDTRALRHWLHAKRFQLKQWIRQSPLRGPAQRAASWTRPLRSWLSLARETKNYAPRRNGQ